MIHNKMNLYRYSDNIDPEDGSTLHTGDTDGQEKILPSSVVLSTSFVTILQTVQGMWYLSTWTNRWDLTYFVRPVMHLLRGAFFSLRLRLTKMTDGDNPAQSLPIQQVCDAFSRVVALETISQFRVDRGAFDLCREMDRHSSPAR